VKDAVLAGLAEIPHTSRLYSDVMYIVESVSNGMTKDDVFKMIHEKYDEYTAHGWCHTIPNAMIVAASLLMGDGDFGRSVCMAVETGFDTDCNGATVGSVIGIMNGTGSISEEWSSPINDTIYTDIFGLAKVRISDRVKLTMEHLK
jgi:ADP-ribosylglycohydrolase